MLVPALHLKRFLYKKKTWKPPMKKEKGGKNKKTHRSKPGEQGGMPQDQYPGTNNHIPTFHVIHFASTFQQLYILHHIMYIANIFLLRKSSGNHSKGKRRKIPQA
jgi:hypothetical protein